MTCQIQLDILVQPNSQGWPKEGIHAAIMSVIRSIKYLDGS